MVVKDFVSNDSLILVHDVCLKLSTYISFSMPCGQRKKLYNHGIKTTAYHIAESQNVWVFIRIFSENRLKKK